MWSLPLACKFISTRCRHCGGHSWEHEDFVIVIIWVGCIRKYNLLDVVSGPWYVTCWSWTTPSSRRATAWPQHVLLELDHRDTHSHASLFLLPLLTHKNDTFHLSEHHTTNRIHSACFLLIKQYVRYIHTGNRSENQSMWFCSAVQFVVAQCFVSLACSPDSQTS